MDRPQLPAELIFTIVEIVPSNDRSTLRALSLTSKAFNGAATCLLYRSMTDQKQESHYHFCKLLSTTPQLAELVREYHLPARPWRDPDIIGRKEQLWEYMTKSLLKMTNLKILVVPSMIPVNVIDVLPFVDSQQGSMLSAPFQLEKLIWRSILFSWDDERRSQAIKSFLDSQKTLKYLLWGLGKAPPDITLPKSLRCIGGSARFLVQTLPRFPSINRVHWDTMITTHPESNDDDDPKIYVRQLLMLDVFQRHVQVLRLSGGNQSGYISGMYKIGITVDLQVLIYTSFLPLRTPEILKCFPRLSELIITSRQIPTISFTMVREWVEALFEKHKSLISVYIRWEGDSYRRWLKGELFPGNFFLSKDTILEP